MLYMKYNYLPKKTGSFSCFIYIFHFEYKKIFSRVGSEPILPPPCPGKDEKKFTQKRQSKQTRNKTRTKPKNVEKQTQTKQPTKAKHPPTLPKRSSYLCSCLLHFSRASPSSQSSTKP